MKCGAALAPLNVASAAEQQHSADISKWLIIGCAGLVLLAFLAIAVIAGLFISAVSKIPARTLPVVTLSTKQLLGNPSPAPGFVRAPGHMIYLDLDTQSGRNSVWRPEDIGSSSALYARFKVMRLGTDRFWRPSFWFGLRSKANVSDRAGGVVGLRVSSIGGIDGPLAFQIQNVRGGKLLERHILNARAALNQQIGITIDWKTPHWVTFELSDGETQRMYIPWTVAAVNVSASTGELEIDPLELGTLGPARHAVTDPRAR